MLKEIYEQPRAIADTLRGRLNVERGDVYLEEFGLNEEIIKTYPENIHCGVRYIIPCRAHREIYDRTCCKDSC